MAGVSRDGRGRAGPPRSERQAAQGDRGSVTIIIAVLALAVVMAVIVTEAARAAVLRARADAAADAVALAVAAGGIPAGHQVASQNQAEVVSVVWSGDTVVVDVVYLGVVARAAAERSVDWVTTPP